MEKKVRELRWSNLLWWTKNLIKVLSLRGGGFSAALYIDGRYFLLLIVFLSILRWQVVAIRLFGMCRNGHYWRCANKTGLKIWYISMTPSDVSTPRCGSCGLFTDWLLSAKCVVNNECSQTYSTLKVCRDGLPVGAPRTALFYVYVDACRRSHSGWAIGLVWPLLEKTRSGRFNTHVPTLVSGMRNTNMSALVTPLNWP